MDAEQLRGCLIEILASAKGPTTTSAALIAVTDKYSRDQRRPVVVEEVYRALLILQRRGIVRRVRRQQPGRHARWQLARRAQRLRISSSP